jgi:hypothetical protein
MTANGKRQLTLLAGMFILLGSAVSARADFVFNFNSLAASLGDNSAAVATYMDNLLCGGGNCVTVTGAATDRTYNGEGHVVGPSGVGRTLGNTDGATNDSGPATPTSTTYDTFLANTTDGSHQISTQITIKFIGFVINGPVTFDYQIFPDISGLPDFKFAVNGNVNSPLFTTLGATPGTTNGSSTHSHLSSSESSKQFIGTWSGTLHNVTELDFIDWPATIAIDDLKIATPEPKGGVFFLGALALAAMAGTRLRRAFAKS